MKNLTKTSIITLLTLLTLFISNCGEKVREEITERYDDGKKKTIMKFVGEGSEEVMAWIHAGCVAVIIQVAQIVQEYHVLMRM